MSEKRRKFDQEFREGAVRIVRDTGKPIAQVARDLGVHAGTLGNWVSKDRAEREGTQGLSTGDFDELKRLRSILQAEREHGYFASSPPADPLAPAPIRLLALTGRATS
ncbi:transposase [Mycobacterium sp. THU-M104]|uniref:transposase n=1 Tax=Mycobacterium sp. THU-M104 TaxID=3410515 RepID=UPI003B9CE4DB